MIRSILRLVLDRVRRNVGSLARFKNNVDSFQTAILFEIGLEESSCFHVDTHCSKNDGEIVFMHIMDIFTMFDQACLTTDLCCDFVVRKTSSRENGQLLPSGDRVHAIYGRYPRLYHFLRVDARVWIDSRAYHKLNEL